MSSESRMIYIDTLRMVSPGDSLKTEHFDFFLLGSFDAMRVIPADCGEQPIVSFKMFQEINRRRNIEIPVLYDKQPMCLYTENEKSLEIFFNEDQRAQMPLVMTLVQLHDEKLGKDISTPGKLIEAFRGRLNEIIGKEPDFEEIEYEVFYSLGEADVVIAFRNKSVDGIARLLFRLRVWDTINDADSKSEGIRILSICSHCGFPKGKDDADFRKNFQRWMEEEKNQKFVTLVNSSYGAQNDKEKDDKGKDKFKFDQYLLGEYDYLSEWTEDNACSRTKRYCDEIVEPMLRPKTDQTLFSRTAFTLPVVHLRGNDLYYAESKQTLNALQPSDKYEGIISPYTKEDSAFQKIADFVKEDRMKAVLGSPKNAEISSEKLKALVGTLIALLKHLIRLREGRFEGDLYAYVAPIFKALPDVAESYANLLDNLGKQYDDVATLISDPEEQEEERDDLSNRLCSLLSEYIEDISKLISLLQHLFSIMSVSPHTYLETYGSSMRSIAATCKLLYAYGGIADRVSRDFEMELQDSSGNVSGNVNETMLLVPYRSIHQSTRTLFEHSAPTVRIVSVHLDFSEMMNIEETLYLLLHEVGHHIMTPDFRSARKKCLTAAVLACLLQNGLGELYDDPCSYMDIMALSDDEIKNGERHIPIKDIREVPVPINKTLTVSSDDIVRYSIKDGCEEAAGKICEDIDKGWDDFVATVDKKEEPLALNNMFTGMLKKQLNEWISSEIQEAYEENSICEGAYLVKYIELIYVNAYFGECGKALYRYAEGHSASDSGRWRFDELRAYYDEIERYKEVREEHWAQIDRYRKDNEAYWENRRQRRAFTPKPQKPDSVMPGFVERAIKKFLKKIEMNYKTVIEEIFCMASDIYSDIFAFYMLRLDEVIDGDRSLALRLAESYVNLFKQVSGFSENENCEILNRLLRLQILVTKCYGLPKDEADQMIVSVLFGCSPNKKKKEEELNASERSAYYGYIIDFADICIQSIKDRRDEKMDEVTHKLKEMYMSAREDGSDNLNRVMESVHYFWMASTKRTGV